jgi:hypothetical protein
VGKLSQSSAIAAGIIIAFVVFVTVRGELPCYLAILGIASAGCQVPGVTGVATSSFNLFGGPSTTPGVGVGVGPGGVTVGVSGPGGAVKVPIPGS